MSDPCDAEKLYNYMLEKNPGGQGWANHLKAQIREYRDEIERLNGRTQYCLGCEERQKEIEGLYQFQRDVDAEVNGLRAELEKKRFATAEWERSVAQRAIEAALVYMEEQTCSYLDQGQADDMAAYAKRVGREGLE